MAKYNPALMKRAIRAAEKARGLCSPNPFVGAVIVKDDSIIAEGWTQAYGNDHAEVHALKQAGDLARGAEIYVTLEPCSHWGKTPPCATAIIEAGITKVWVGITDPNPLVSGKGIKMLRDAGIEVEYGFFPKEISKQLEYHLCRIQKKRPFVIWKAAISLDGKIAAEDGSSRWITGESSRRRVHKLRSEVDLVLTGIGTVLRDDPLLNSRYRGAKHQPARVVLDPLLEIPLDSQIARTADRYRSIVFCSESALVERELSLRAKGLEVYRLDSCCDSLDLALCLDALHKLGYYSVLLECGSKLASAFIKAELVDKLMLFLAPKLLGGKLSVLGEIGVESIEEALNLKDLELRKSGEDILITGYL